MAPLPCGAPWGTLVTKISWEAMMVLFTVEVKPSRTRYEQELLPAVGVGTMNRAMPLLTL